uniref:Lipase n=1 Tax=Parastrongyloides trichosuri TaxID=131310 RepID=A0A0N5A518_PARTI
MTTKDICETFGYTFKSYKVITEDGYILELHRIPCGKDGKKYKNVKRPTIFLQHGLEGSSAQWICNDPSHSAAFIFADHGFDVFLGNMRGNIYSNKHINLKSNEKKFWAFSFDQMIKYDIDALINKALEITKNDSLYYIGHSQGTLTLFGKLAIDPSFNKKIRMFFCLAPVCTVKYIKGSMKTLSLLLKPSMNLFFKVKPGNKMFPWPRWANEITTNFMKLWFVNELTSKSISGIFGPSSQEFDSKLLHIYIRQALQGTSSQNWKHWLQLVYSKTFQMYDYKSRKRNMEIYGQETAPIYDLTNVNVPIIFFYGMNDYLATEEDLKEYILPKLNKNSYFKVYKLESFNHVDFIWSKKAASDIYFPILYTVINDYFIKEGIFLFETDKEEVNV